VLIAPDRGPGQTDMVVSEVVVKYVAYEGPIVHWKEAKDAGLTRYFSGVLCKFEHVSQRMVSSRGCLTCTKIKLEERRLRAVGQFKIRC